VQTKTRNARELDEVVRWRCEQLVESCFPPALAARVAKNAHYELHALIELVERGCQPDIAVRILASVEEESAA
jgi:hypothetical protein